MTKFYKKREQIEGPNWAAPGGAFGIQLWGQLRTQLTASLWSELWRQSEGSLEQQLKYQLMASFQCRKELE